MLARVRVTSRPAMGFGDPTVARWAANRVGNARLRYFDVAPDGRTVVSVINPVRSDAGTVAQINIALNWIEELKARVPTK